MHTLSLLTLFAACVAALPADVEIAQGLGKRVVCAGITTCSSISDFCCGYNCCPYGCDLSGSFCSSAPSSCKLTDYQCGSECCDLLNGIYCDLVATTCTSSSFASPTPYTPYTPAYSPLPTPATSCYSYQTTCGSACCDSTETCSVSSSGNNYCASNSADTNTDGGSSDEPDRHSTPKSSSSSSSKKFPPKAIAGVVIGVVVGLALIVGAVLRFCCGVGKKSKKNNGEGEVSAIELPPPIYGEEQKQMQHEVKPVVPEMR